MIPRDKEKKIGMYTFTTFKNKSWIKLLYHNVTGKIEFNDENEALYYVNRSNKQLYSIIKAINNESRINGKFEFILEYPNERKYVQWKQLNYPLYEKDVSGKSITEGFEPDDSAPQGFKGLAYSMIYEPSNCRPSLLDGSLGSSNFFYAVGMMKCPTPHDHSSIPAISSSTKVMSFWMRVKSFNIYTYGGKTKSLSLTLIIFILVCLS